MGSFSSINKKKKKATITVSLSIVILGIMTSAVFIYSIVGSDIKNNNKIEDTNNNLKDQNKDLQEKVITKFDAKAVGNNTSELGKEYVVSRFDVQNMINGTYVGRLADKKIVFLTFDDGPSHNTLKVLDILKENNIHATFFVLGQEIVGNEDIIKKIYDNGNAIGNHSYSHKFKTLYPKNSIDIDAYMDEYKKTEKRLKNILGKKFSTNLVRMPGGENSRIYYNDKNLAPLKEAFKNESIESIDWNSLNGDAEGQEYSVEQMLEYVKASSSGGKHIVVLMHDAAAKEMTVKALPQIIEYFKSQGYEFRTIG